MINKSIAYRISIYISLAVIVVFIAIISISYSSNRDFLFKNLEDSAIAISSEIIMKVDKDLVSTREIASNISEQIMYFGNHNDAEILIRGMLERYPFLNAIRVNIESGIPNLVFHNYYGYRKNDSIVYFQQNKEVFLCPVEKKVLDEIKNKNVPNWTEPVRCPKNNNAIVSYYSPIESIEEGSSVSFIGEVICELSLSNINDTINSFDIGNQGFAFLLSKKGVYLTHPIEEWILNRNVYEISDKIYDKNKVDVKSILENNLAGSIIAYSEALNFEKSKVYYAPVKENGWTLVLTMPYNKLFEPLYVSMLRMLFFSVLGILIIYLTVTYITNRLVQPLSTVTSQLKKFSNFSGEQELNTLNEVKLVSESLNYIRLWYEKHKINETQEKSRSHRRKQDLTEASEIQQSLVKTDFPAFPEIKEIELYATYLPARVVSGDLYDYFFLDDNNLIFTIGDVSGKGIPAAIFMSIAQTIIKSNASFKKARTIVDRVNKDLCTNNHHQFFLTLFVGVLNLKTGVLYYCNAAHTTTYILKPNSEIIELEESHGLPLGLYPDKNYTDSKISLEAGDSIILYTDGVTEQQNENKIQYGNKKFVKNIRDLTNLGPKEKIDSVNQSLKLYRGEALQTDDISILIVEFKQKKEA